MPKSRGFWILRFHPNTAAAIARRAPYLRHQWRPARAPARPIGGAPRRGVESRLGSQPQLWPKSLELRYHVGGTGLRDSIWNSLGFVQDSSQVTRNRQHVCPTCRTSCVKPWWRPSRPKASVPPRAPLWQMRALRYRHLCPRSGTKTSPPRRRTTINRRRTQQRHGTTYWLGQWTRRRGNWPNQPKGIKEKAVTGGGSRRRGRGSALE